MTRAEILKAEDQARLEEIEARVNEVRRSDDFGHDTHALLLWESEQYTILSEQDVPYLLGVCKSLEAEVKYLRDHISHSTGPNDKYWLEAADAIAKERDLAELGQELAKMFFEKDDEVKL
jgi:hypothetical protein